MAMKSSVKIKKDDRVMVMTGRERGKIGRVLKVEPAKERVLVEKINMVKRHTKPTQTGQGGIMDKEAPLHISKLQVVCPKCNQAVRVGSTVLEDGRRVRVCKKCSEQLDS